MTHRGPFQPLLFCDSVILVLQRGPGVCHTQAQSTLRGLSSAQRSQGLSPSPANLLLGGEGKG